MKPHLPLSVARVHFCAEGVRTFGAATFIAPDTLLTARHVVDPLEHSLHGAARNDCVKVESNAGFGLRWADGLLFPADPALDLALIKLDGAKSVDRLLCGAIHPAPREVFSVGDFVDVTGFVSAEGDLQADRVRVMGVHERAGAYICNKSVPEGYSGGPVMIDSLIVGVMYARNHGQGQSYFYGVDSAVDFLRKQCADCEFRQTVAHMLRRYPLGPALPRTDIGRMLSLVIRECARTYRRYDAEQIIHDANAARTACGPPVGLNGLLDLAELPNPDSPFDFWHEAFYLAGLKSPRMLAALLESLDSERLSDSSRHQKAAMLEHMSHR